MVPKNNFALLLGLTFICGLPLHAMQKQKEAAVAAAGTQDPELKTYDLKKELGYHQMLEITGKEDAACEEYLSNLQMLASTLYMQDQYITTYTKYVLALQNFNSYRAQYDQLIPDTAVVVPHQAGKKTIYIECETTEELIIGLHYKDLLTDPHLSLKMPDKQFQEIIQSLHAHANNRVRLLGDLLQANHNVQKARVVTSQLEIEVQNMQGILAKMYQTTVDYIKGKTSEVGTFIFDKIKILIDQTPPRDYAGRRNELLALYNTALLEIKTTILTDPERYRKYAYRWKTPKELLPGIEKSSPILHLTVQAVQKPETPTQPKATRAPESKKNKGKTKQQAQTPSQQATQKNETEKNCGAGSNALGQEDSAGDANREDSDNSPFTEVTRQNTARVARLRPMTSQDSLFVTIPGNEETTFHIYKVPGNANMFQDLSCSFAYDQNVSLWRKNPEQALLDNGYHDPKSPKHARAWKNRYANDADMRKRMCMYHAFPQAIDQYIQQYGQVKEISRPDRQKPTVFKKYLCIAIPGEVVFQDGTTQRGLFSYVINPRTSPATCFHRMFEPKKLSAFDPAAYDIDTDSVEEDDDGEKASASAGAGTAH